MKLKGAHANRAPKDESGHNHLRMWLFVCMVPRLVRSVLHRNLTTSPN